MKILGIDLAGSEKRKTGICILNEKLKTSCFCLKKDKEILKLIEKEKPDLICVDAPLSLPKGRKSLRRSKIHFRKCDLELRKFGIKFFPITLGPMRKLTKRGMKLRKVLETKKFKVIEVYPGATQDILKIPRKNEGLEKLKKGLERLKIKILKENPNGDELDAITCAFTGWLFLKGKCISLGDKSEGQIVIPSFNFRGRKK